MFKDYEIYMDWRENLQETQWFLRAIELDIGKIGYPWLPNPTKI